MTSVTFKSEWELVCEILINVLYLNDLLLLGLILSYNCFSYVFSLFFVLQDK